MIIQISFKETLKKIIINDKHIKKYYLKTETRVFKKQNDNWIRITDIMCSDEFRLLMTEIKNCLGQFVTAVY
jgi:hypothetical protein